MNLFHLLRTILVLLVAMGSASFASAAERAYRTHSTAVLDLASGVFVAEGNGTHLGNYTELGQIFITGDNPAALDVEGSAILTDANGDELLVSITGTMNFLTGAITGTLTIEGAPSGRFENATGSALLVAQLQENGTIAVNVAGSIGY